MSPGIELERAYASLPLGERPAKPRAKGLTITVEFGVGPRAQEDYLTLASHTLDYAKQVVSTAGLMPKSVLQEKIEIYREHGVKAFPGGMFLEYAHSQGQVAEYLKESADVGYSVIEVSENARGLDRTARADIVSRALDLGFEVLGEVGSKHVKTGATALVEDVGDLLGLGCSLVLIEAAELMESGQVDEDLVGRIEAAGVVDRCAFELPGPWIPGTHAHEAIALEMWLLDRFGPEVNIANDAWGNSLYLEACRRKIGANLFE